jgi:hypothetical protein
MQRRELEQWLGFGALGALLALGCLAIGVGLGHAIKDPAPSRDAASLPVQQAVDMRLVQPNGQVVAPAPARVQPPTGSFDPLTVSTPVRAEPWSLDAPFPPDDVLRQQLDVAMPAAPTLVARPVTRDELDALPRSVIEATDRHRAVRDAAFPPSWGGLPARF